MAWPKWKEQEFEKIQVHYHDFLSTVYSEEDCKAAALPNSAGDMSLLLDDLETLDENLQDMMKSLDDVSELSDDDNSSSEDESPPKKRKRQPKQSEESRKKKAIDKGGDDVTTKGKERASGKENDSSASSGSMTGKPWLSAYEITRLENIERIRNNPTLKQLNEEIRQLQEERRPPIPSPSHV